MTKDVNWSTYVSDYKLSVDYILKRRLSLPDPTLVFMPSNAFEDIRALEVLDLSTTHILSLPSSISCLRNLQELYLRDCPSLFELPTDIGRLTKLKLFDINGTELMFLPKEMANLTNLEVLRVSFPQYAKYYIETNNVSETVIPRNMISELKQLKELCITICVGEEPEWWEKEVSFLQNELCDLENLQTLRWYLPTDLALQQFLLLERKHVPIYAHLSNLMLTIGQHAQLTSCLPRDVEKKFQEFKNGLKLTNAEGSVDGISKILASAEALFLSRHWTVDKISNFNVTKLKYCLISECNEMEALIEAENLSEDVEARKMNGDNVGLELLEYLSIHSMNKLQSIWKGPIGKDSLSKLKILALHTCPKLTAIFTPTIVQNLLCLTEPTVEYCPEVTCLVSKESHNITSSPVFPSLERIVLLDLLELVNIVGVRIVLEKLRTFLIYNSPKLQLADMELPHIEKIEGEGEWWDDLKCDKSLLEEIFVPLKEDRDVIEQLSEATNSLQHLCQKLPGGKYL